MRMGLSFVLGTRGLGPCLLGGGAGDGSGGSAAAVGYTAVDSGELSLRGERERGLEEF